MMVDGPSLAHLAEAVVQRSLAVDELAALHARDAGTPTQGAPVL